MTRLVVTLAVEASAEARFATDCARHGGVPHVVLFRAVPGELEHRVRVDLVRAAGPPFPVGVAGVLPLADGVAYALVSPELTRRHRTLQQAWWDGLGERDRRPLRAHVLVQTGVPAAQARALVGILRRTLRPHEIRAEGFVLWRDDPDGRTELARIPFAGAC